MFLLMVAELSHFIILISHSDVFVQATQLYLTLLLYLFMFCTSLGHSVFNSSIPSNH